MLCKIETGKVNPSITLLRRLAQSLHVNISALFEDTSGVGIVQRAGKRPLRNDGNLRNSDGAVLERLIRHAPSVNLQADIHEIAPCGASDGQISHLGEEMGYVLEGVVELRIDNQRWRLEPGDSFHFRPERPHSYRNVGPTLARILWVNTPTTF